MAIATEVFNHNKNHISKEDENLNISWSIGHISSRNFKTSSFRRGLLSFLLTQHNLKHEVRKITYLMPMIKLVFSKVIFAFQLSSIGWNQYSFSSWNSIDSFWNILGYARIDNIFSELELLEYFLCSIVFIVWIYFILLIAIHLLTSRSKRISLILIKLANWWRVLIFGIGLIPMLYSLIIAMKYLIFYRNIRMAEYQNKDLNSNLLVIAPIFIITTILLLIFYYIHEILIYEFRHSHVSYTWYAKSHSNSDKIKFFGIIFILIYSMLCDSSHIKYKKIIISTFAFIVCLLNLYYIPYFSPESNFFEACSMLITAINSLAFFIGEIQGNSSIGFVLFLFLNPILSWILYMIFKYRYSKLMKLNSIKKYIDVYEFERAMRPSLLHKESQSEEILEIFESAYFNNKLNISRLIAIWEADFCLNSLKNPRLASIKIGLEYPWKKLNFEEEFLEYCLRKQLYQQLCQNCEDAQFLMCLEKLENWQKTDKKFCLDLIDVINLIYIDHLPVQKIFPSIVKMNKKFNYLKKDYKEIISSFPRSSEAHRLFFKNIDDINNLMESEELTLQKNRYENNINTIAKNAEKLNYFEESSGIMIVSGCKNNVGTVLYANNHAAKILRETTFNIIGSDISDYIPYPYNINHKLLLKNFLHSSTTGEIDHSNDAIFVMKSGFLVEVAFSIKCSSFDKYPFFLILFRESYDNRPICLLNENGRIIGFSQHFPLMLYLSEDLLLNKSIFDFKIQIGRNNIFKKVNTKNLPYPEIIFFSDNDFLKLSTSGGYILCQFILKPLFSKSLYILAITHDDISKNAALTNLRSHLKDLTPRDDSFQQEGTHSLVPDIELATTNVGNVSNNEVQQEIVKKGVTVKKLKLLTKSNQIHCPGEENEQDIKNTSIDMTNSQDLSKFIKDQVWWEIYLSKIRRQFRIYKWILFFSIITIITTNGIILALTLSETNKANDINSLKETGLILDTMIGISNNAMKMDIYAYSKASSNSISKGAAKMNVFIDTLQNMTQEMLGELSTWNYCPKFSFYVKNEIPMWETIGNYKMVKKNLIDIMQEYENIAGNFVKSFLHNESYVDDLNFLTLNSIGVLAKQYDHLMDVLASCEKYRAEELTGLISLLIIIANIMLCICFCVIFYILCTVCRTLQKFYEVISQKIRESYGGIQNKLITRLTEIHGYDYVTSSNLSRSIPIKRWFTNDYARMFLKIFIYFLLTFAFYFIFYFYAYKRGEYYLMNRPSFIALMIKRQLYGRIIAFWTRVYAFEDTPISLSSRLSKNYIFSAPYDEYFSLLNSYKDLKLPLRNNEMQKFMSNELRIMTFERLESSPDYATYGASPCLDEQLFESIYLFDASRNLTKFSGILANIDTIRDTLNKVNYNIIDIATNHSTNLIQENFQLLTILTAIYAVFSILIYFCFYLPSISKEFSRLATLQRFCKLI